MQSVGERIARARKIAGLTQTDLGAKAGVGAALIQKIEGNKAGPSARAVMRVARVLGVEFDGAALVDGELRRSTSQNPLDSVIAAAARNTGQAADVISQKLASILRGDDPQAYDQLRGAASMSPKARAAVERKKKRP